jgi:hypothetical protein
MIWPVAANLIAPKILARLRRCRPAAMNDDEPDFSAAELCHLLRVHARDKCAVCGVELQTHFGIAKRAGGHFFRARSKTSRR